MKNYLINKPLRYFLVVFVGAFIFAACDNTMESVDAPGFAVSADQTTYKVGDIVTFNLKGNPDIISFYSGESGNDYEYANKDRYMDASVEFDFQTQVRSQTGPNTYCQDDQFHLYYSHDFAFDGTNMADSINNVQSATWVEITDKFVMCPLECSSNTAYKFSETLDITDLFEENKPVYFAFRYINRPYSQFGNGNIWRFSGLKMNAVTPAGIVSLLSQNTANWKPIFIGEGWDKSRFTSTATVVTMRGPSTNEVDQELWAISEGALLDTNMGYDLAVAIKSAFEVPLKEYEHIYTEPGTYTVTFVARNSNIYEGKEVVKQLQITITE